MRLHHLSLENYRNYKDLSISFTGNIHFFIGDNAQGKTNLLEAIYLLALTKSHRTNKDRELIMWNKDQAKVRCELTLFKRNIELEVEIDQQKKRVLINKIEKSKFSEFVGNLKVVLFAPEDLQLIKGSPFLRRRFMDRALGQLRLKYVNDLAMYQKVVQQRNQLLKDTHRKKSLLQTLDLWDMQLIEYGTAIINIREQFIKDIEKYAENIHNEITDGKEQLKLIYDASCLAGKFQEKLEKSRDKDLQFGTTNIGPHRDELQFIVNNKDIKIYGSQGQQRTVALSIKLAELEYMKQQMGDMPILLLDDVLSELDLKRQKKLLDTIGEDIQTFVTTTDVDGIKHNIIKKSDFFHIKDGNLIKG
ncbi:DNA replication/repair protein RecF [Desulfuribacillus alkaliarsenatis]|uniref:DNA replication and repair protein RecF n=1 Tax=Desulfuribacillus alkaliarsenatis TaxID=766136 RepID=A0A1E5G2P8_9FIRM|nr:DNA replication/repair protein RecF [Desulfuribacillus alkaliarsenatis]OEF97311.1 DNA replication/repair protein RecF [Desulfuribacillus alkaliarsenatis]